MENQTEKVYKPRARKVPGGESISIVDDSKPHEPIVLREIKEDIPKAPKWVLTESGWEMQ